MAGDVNQRVDARARNCQDNAIHLLYIKGTLLQLPSVNTTSVFPTAARIRFIVTRCVRVCCYHLTSHIE